MPHGCCLELLIFGSMPGQWIGIVVGLSCSFGRKVRAGGRTIDASTLPRAATAPVARNAWSMPATMRPG